MYKSGFIAIIGRPNVGKSTLMNTILKQKISIVSSKPQTTRNQIRGIYTTETEQMIFIDTPGIHKPHNKLGNLMNEFSLRTFKDVDVILWIVDATQNFGSGDEFIINSLKMIKTPIFIVFNKMDLIKKNALFQENKHQFLKQFSLNEVYEISALENINVNQLLNNIPKYMEEGPQYYPSEQVSDYPEKFIIQELIREKILLLTKEEVPHSIAVVVEDMKQEEVHLMAIRANIFVERSSQKKIIIGNNGQMIKKIGTLARKDIVMLLGCKIYLDLWVKVEENWRDRQEVIKRMGYYWEK